MKQGILCFFLYWAKKLQMNNLKVFFWSITVALGGFLFGFDTAVISGAEQSIQSIWNLSDFEHGLAVAIALYGTVIGALIGGIPADIFGRRTTLFVIALLYLISALGSALAPEVYSFMVFRFLGGVGVGASSVAAPMYISEISPAGKRGRLVALFQFNIVLGILIAYVTNFFLAGIGESAWRWMLGVETLPAMAFFTALFFVPESPRWLLLKKNNRASALATMKLIDPDNAESLIRKIEEQPKEGRISPFKVLTSKKYRFPVLLAFFLAFFNQLSGINAIIYYAPRIFSMTGMANEAAFLSSAGIGLINLIFTMIGMSIIDRVGRKSLMYIGSVGLIFTLGIVSYSFYSESFSPVPFMLFGFIGFFAMSQGAVIWVFISEIFPNRVRAFGQSFGSFTHWLLAAIVANAFPVVANAFGAAPIFGFFSLMMILQLVFVIKVMPETKGVSLEDMEQKLAIR